MRNPIHVYDNPLVDADTFERIAKDDMYWQSLNRTAYTTILENVIDSIGATNLSRVYEVQAGHGHMIDLLREVFKLYDIDPKIYATELNEKLSASLNNIYGHLVQQEVNSDVLANVDLVVIAEATSTIPHWKKYVDTIVQSLKKGAYVLVMDSAVSSNYRSYLKTVSEVRLADEFTFKDAPAYKDRQGRNRLLKARLYQIA